MAKLLLVALSLLPTLQTKPTLQINVKGISDSTGYIMIAIYNSESTFLTTEVSTGSRFDVNQTGSLICPVDLDFGRYAVSIYHDVDANEELNTNLLGIPTEPTGFSNNPKSLFGPPGYQKVLFSFDKDGQEITINLN